MRHFLAERFSLETNLLNESPFTAPNVYWLINDNQDGAAAIRSSMPTRAFRAYRAMASLGYITNDVNEAWMGQTIPWPPLSDAAITVQTGPNYVIKTELRNGAVISSWASYADLLAIRAITLHMEGDTVGATSLMTQLENMWDGVGMNDAIHQGDPDGLYAAYKVAGAIIAADTLGYSLANRGAMLERLGRQQRSDGGIVTGYRTDGTRVGDANTETTALTLLAVFGAGAGEQNLVRNGAFEKEGAPGRPSDWYYSETGTSWSTSVFRSGGHSIAISDPSTSAAANWRSTTFAVTPGRRLRWSFFHQRNVSAGSFRASLRFFRDAGATDFVAERVLSFTGTSATWQHDFLFDVVVPPTAAYADVRFVSDEAAVGTWILDDVDVFVLPDPVGDAAQAYGLSELNRVRNADFESGGGDPTKPSDWYSSVFGTYWDTTQSVSANHSILIVDDSTEAAADFRATAFPVVSGESLVLSLYETHLGIVGNFGTFLRYFGESGGFLGQDVILVSGSNGGWEYRELRSSVPPGAKTADVRVFTNDATNTGQIAVDDVSVDSNLVDNARVELGSGGNPNDWYHSAAFASWVVADDAPSYQHVLQIEDNSASAGGDWRCKAFNVTGFTRLGFSFKSKRFDLAGGPAALLRFFDGQGAFISEATVVMSGNTTGWEQVTTVADVPAGAATADIVLKTSNDATITGTLQFDDIAVSPAVLPEIPGIAQGACCLPDYTCVQTDEDTCASLSGTFHGDGTTCAEADCTSTCLDTINRVANPTVEAATNNWPDQWYHSTTGAVYDETQSVSPSHSLTLDDVSTTSSANWRSTAFVVTPGEAINFSFYEQHQAIVGNFGAFLRFFDAGGTWLGQQAVLLSASGSDWQYHELPCTVPAAAATADVFFFTNDVTNTGVASFDNVAVDNNLIRNGRVELGTGASPSHWFHSAAFTSWATPSDAPSYRHVLEIDDSSDTETADWRSEAFAVARYGRLGFCFRSKRSSLTGSPAALLRFFDAQGTWIGQETMLLNGETNGFERSALVVDVPSAASTADVMFVTFNDPTITGTLQFDDISVVPLGTRPCPAPAADADGDNDVDLADFGTFQNCFNGPNRAWNPAGPYQKCACLDQDKDGDVDLADFGVFQACFNGPNRPPRC
ncbi:MAG: hypothetical protein ACPMAQ_00050 [Phycisphaerae bacterium]